MSSSTAPLKLARLVSLFLAFVFGIVGLALGIHADVDSNNTKDFAKQHAPFNAQVDIDTSDVFSVGTVVVVVCGLLAVVSLILLPLVALEKPVATRTLPVQTGMFGFLTIWLFAALVPYTDFTANRAAKISATLPDGTPIPDGLVQTVQSQLGISSKYSDQSSLRDAVALSWIAFLFALTTTILSFLAQRRARAADTTRGYATTGGAVPIETREDEKRDKANVRVAQAA